MKILVVGDFMVDFHEEAFYQGFSKEGHEVKKFKVASYFNSNIAIDQKKGSLMDLYYRFQRKFGIGPVINQLNKDLVLMVQEFKPDFVFIYRGILISAATVKKISQISKIFVYNNDDPFGLGYGSYFWRHYKKGLKYVDWIFYYRPKNEADYEQLGLENKSLLRSYYLEEKNFSLELSLEQKVYDVIFIGHYEADGRDQILLNLLKNTSYKIKIFGPEWHRSPLYQEFLSIQGDIVPVRAAYNETINQAKIALVFFSKLNNDTYTRRVFEITATKTLMLSEYTDDMASMFAPDQEACYFKNEAELNQQINTLLSNEERITGIGTAGQQRLVSDGHAIDDRVKEVLATYNRINLVR